MVLSSKALVFPVVYMGNDVLWVFSNFDSLTRSTARAVRGRHLKGVLVCDSHGSVFEVEQSKIVGGVGPFWGYRLGVRIVRIELQVNKVDGAARFEDVRARAMEIMNASSSWTTTGCHSRLIHGLRGCTSIKELVSVLAPFA
jgi:hypothetical protein